MRASFVARQMALGTTQASMQMRSARSHRAGGGRRLPLQALPVQNLSAERKGVGSHSEVPCGGTRLCGNSSAVRGSVCRVRAETSRLQR